MKAKLGNRRFALTRQASWNRSPFGSSGLKFTPSFTLKMLTGKMGVSPCPRPASVARSRFRVTMRPSGEVSVP